MTFAQRGRSLSVSGFLLAGATGIISSTQTWLTVDRADAGAAILVPGASALVLLAPLSLAVLALGAALAIAGKAVRLVFGVLAAAAALFLGWSTIQLLIVDPLGAATATVTEATGLAGSAAVHGAVASIVPSAWAYISLVGWMILLIASIVVLMTWRSWKSGGRRYRTDNVDVAHDGAIDAVDSWDELSRGTDPTR